MCTGAEIALLASAAGAATTMVAQDQRDRATDRAIQQGAEEESKIQRRANNTTNDYVRETFTPETRTQNYEAQATKREQSLGDILAQASEGQGTAATGAVSSDYTRAKAAADANSSARASKSARLLARGGALGDLFGNEAIRGGDYASDMLGFNADSNMNRTLTNSNVRRAQRKGRELELLGGLMSAYGMSGAPGAGVVPRPTPFSYGLEGMAGYNIPKF